MHGHPLGWQTFSGLVKRQDDVADHGAATGLHGRGPAENDHCRFVSRWRSWRMLIHAHSGDCVTYPPPSLLLHLLDTEECQAKPMKDTGTAKMFLFDRRTSGFPQCRHLHVFPLARKIPNLLLLLHRCANNVSGRGTWSFLSADYTHLF